jgi:hypothetical protein
LLCIQSRLDGGHFRSVLEAEDDAKQCCMKKTFSSLLVESFYDGNNGGKNGVDSILLNPAESV